MRLFLVSYWDLIPEVCPFSCLFTVYDCMHMVSRAMGQSQSVQLWQLSAARQKCPFPPVADVPPQDHPWIHTDQNDPVSAFPDFDPIVQKSHFYYCFLLPTHMQSVLVIIKYTKISAKHMRNPFNPPTIKGSDLFSFLKQRVAANYQQIF